MTSLFVRATTHLSSRRSRRVRRARGVTFIEYALIAALVVALIITAFALLGPAMNTLWSKISGVIAG